MTWLQLGTFQHFNFLILSSNFVQNICKRRAWNLSNPKTYESDLCYMVDHESACLRLANNHVICHVTFHFLHTI
jgi:hypothetical protein